VPPRRHVIAGIDVGLVDCLVASSSGLWIAGVDVGLVDCLVTSSSGSALSWEGTVFAPWKFGERDPVTYF